MPAHLMCFLMSNTVTGDIAVQSITADDGLSFRQGANFFNWKKFKILTVDLIFFSLSDITEAVV